VSHAIRPVVPFLFAAAALAARPALAQACHNGQTCEDASGGGDYACLDPNTSNGVPTDATTCSASQPCPAGHSCWSLSQGAATGVCLMDCTGSGGGGTGGGSGDGGHNHGDAGGGGGGTPGTCSNSAFQCVDASGRGNFACLDPGTSNRIPVGAPACSASQACAAGFDCWSLSQGATSGVCLENCTAGGGTGGGSGGGSGDGGHNHGTDSGPGSCSNSARQCVDASGSGGYACVDPSTSDMIPTDAPSCSASQACPAGSDCWSVSQGSSAGVCLEACTTGGDGSTDGSGGGDGTGGATEPPRAVGSACQTSAQCEIGLTCAASGGQKNCRTRCALSTDCTGGAACITSGGVGACIPASTSGAGSETRTSGGCASAGAAGAAATLGCALARRRRPRT